MGGACSKARGPPAPILSSDAELKDFLVVWTRVLSPADPVKRLLSPGAKLPDEDTAEHADGEESSEAPTPRKLSRGGSGRKSHAIIVENDVKSVILCVRTHHYKATVNVLVKNRRTLKRKGSEGDLSASQVESMPLDEMRELLPEEFKNEVEEDPENDGLNEIDESEAPVAAGEEKREPPAGRLLALRVADLQPGENQIQVVVTAESGLKSTTHLRLARKQWAPEDWEPGSNRDKFFWYCLGAADNNPMAQFRLALMYAEEDGFVEVPKGTEQGDIEDFAGYAHRMKRRGVAEENLVRLDRKIAVRRQVRWLFKSAENGFVPAMNRLALMFSNGEVPKDTMDELVAKASDDMKADVANRHKQAARWYLAAAQKGDAHAAKQLGNMFIEGVGVDADYKKAMGWLQKAGHKAEESMRLVYDRYKQLADRGNKSAAYQLALMHVDGAGAEKNYKTAVKFNEKAGKLPRDAAEEIANLFQQAAKDGQQDAAYQLALMHMDGVGVDMDYKKALYFLDRAGVDKERSFRQVVDVFTEKAHAGDKRAQYQLGLIYCDGVGVHMDYKTAISWMVKSGESEEKVAHFVADRLMLAANKGNQRSAYQRALMHVDGVGVEMDYKVALDWLEKSGQPVTQAHQQAAQWFRTNAESGDKRSAYQLALMYVDGVGVDMDYKEALEWLRRAGQKDDFAQQLVSSRLQMQAEKRHVPSCKQLALMYMNYKSALTFLEKEGHDEHWYHKQAARWYEVAGEENDESAALTLAQMHVDGVGVPIDFKRATAWFEAGGKDKQFAKKRIDAKLQSLKPKYKMLFDSYAERNGGKVDLVQFAGFYRDCLLAKGLPKDKADQETRGLYQGRPKYEILFQSYDKNRDHSIDFEEIWSHEHTHTSLFPKTGAHVMAANEFFSHFHPLARAQSIQELTQDLNLTGPLSSRARSMGSAGSTLDRARSKRPMSARALTSKGSALALGAFDEGDPDVASPPK